MVDDDWPPKFKVTPEGTAGLFLTAHCPSANGRITIPALVELFQLYYDEGFKEGNKITEIIPDDVAALVNREIPAQIALLETGRINDIGCYEAAVVFRSSIDLLERQGREIAQNYEVINRIYTGVFGEPASAKTFFSAARGRAVIKQFEEMQKRIEQLEEEVLDLKAVDEMRCIGLENKRIRINKQNAYIEQLEADAPRILTDTIDSQAQAIKVMRERIEKLEADSVHGWRSCIDHIIKPDSPCPVCRVEELEAEIEGMHEDAAGDSI